MDDASRATARAAWSERLLLWGPGMVVGLGAGVVTAHGLFVVAAASGVPAGIAWLYPVITDGLALVAYGATHRLHGRGTIYAWMVVVLAAGLSGLAQAIYLADDTVEVSGATRFGVGAWPAIAAALSAHLIYLLGRSTAVDAGPTTSAASSGDALVSLPPSKDLARGRQGPRERRSAAQDAETAERIQKEPIAHRSNNRVAVGLAERRSSDTAFTTVRAQGATARPP